jgi:glycosyltransferase involved in cell wall biosynthesis
VGERPFGTTKCLNLSMKALLVHPILRGGSGGDAVAAWILQALVQEHDVSVLTWADVDTDSVNRFCGTRLDPSDFTVLMPPKLVRRAVDTAVALRPHPYDIQSWCLLMRLARLNQDRYDVILSANNEADLGPKGIVYVHYPFLHPALRRGSVEGRFGVDRLAAHVARLRPWRLLSGFSVERMRRQLLLVNSDWTGRVVRAFYGVDPVTVHPPCVDDFPRIHWEDREDGFVAIGRFTPSKRFEWLVEVLDRVRARHPSVHLHLIGVQAREPEAEGYYRSLRRLVAENALWITLHEDLPRAELANVVTRHRYGIHGMEEEHYGMSVADMVQGECIVFTPGGGGQTEVTGGDARITFSTVDDAVAKILRVIEDREEQTALRAHLALRREHLDATRFVRDIQAVVRTHAATAGRP